MIRRVWQRFRPKQIEGNPSSVKSLSGNIFIRAASNVERIMQKRHPHEADIEKAIVTARLQAEATGDAVSWLSALILQTPRAVRAQQSIDKHPHGSRDKRTRLYELIDFNDSFVNTALGLSDSDLKGFDVRLKKTLDIFCRRVGSHSFSDEQFSAISRGLSREVAVYRGALSSGFGARMTSRREDALGVDMVITEKSSGRSMNVDCKSPSAYRYRLQDLLREGRLSEDETDQADVRGFAFEVNGRGAEAVDVVLMRVDANELGEIVDFRFEEPTKLAARLKEILNAQ